MKSVVEMGLTVVMWSISIMSVGAFGAQPRVMVQYGGEESLSRGFRLEGAGITPVPSEPGGAKWAIVCDSMESAREWNEFLQTDPRTLRLRDGNGYLFSFRWRLLEGEDCQLYYLARSNRERGRSGVFDMLFWIYDRVKRDRQGKVEREFLLEGTDDYYFIVGIRGRGVVAVDEVSVMDTGRADGPEEVARIKTGRPCPYGERRDWLKKVQQEDGVVERLQHMLVVCSQERMRDPELVAKVIREVSPDIMHCNNFGPIGARWGIRTGVQGMEYDAYYRREGPQYWEGREEYFRGRGFGETRAGDTPTNTIWGEGGYMCCHNGDRWHKAQKQSMLDGLDRYEDIRQDNLTWANFLTGGCYCSACESKFRAYLQGRYSAEELVLWGLSDLGKFSVRAYFNEMEDRLRTEDGYVGHNCLADPIVREYIKFQNLAHLDTWGDSVEELKKKGRRMGRGVGVWGNQVGLDIFPTGMAISPWVDVVQVENHGDEHIFALGRGAGAGRKTVWVGSGYGDGYSSNWATAPEDYLRDRFGFGLAMGGLHDIYLWGQPADVVGATHPENLDSSGTYPFIRRYAKYLREHRALHTMTRLDTRLAVVWSFPSCMWRVFLDLNMDGTHRRAMFCDLGNWLWSNHIAYDVIVFGHPEIWPDEDQLARLADYDVVILPNVDCLSERQIEALVRWREKGGEILFTGRLGTRDENYNPRSGLVVDRMKAEPLKRSEDVAGSLRFCVSFSTKAASEERVTVFRAPEDEYLVVHCWRPRGKVVSGSVSSISVDLTLPEPSRAVEDVVMYTFDGEEKPLSWEFSSGRDRIRFTVPLAGHYAAVAVGKADAWRERNRELQEWIEEDRAKVREYARSHQLR
jgi:hypothetical protein